MISHRCAASPFVPEKANHYPCLVGYSFYPRPAWFAFVAVHKVYVFLVKYSIITKAYMLHHVCRYLWNLFLSKKGQYLLTAGIGFIRHRKSFKTDRSIVCEVRKVHIFLWILVIQSLAFSSFSMIYFFIDPFRNLHTLCTALDTEDGFAFFADTENPINTEM